MTPKSKDPFKYVKGKTEVATAIMTIQNQGYLKAIFEMQTEILSHLQESDKEEIRGKYLEVVNEHIKSVRNRGQ